MRYDLQFFGGRGASAGTGNSPLERNAKPRQIETQYRTPSVSMRGITGYKDEILEAKADKNGNVTFEYATPKARDKTAKTNKTEYVTYEVSHGAINGEIFGVNLDKANSVSGQTYNLREELKKKGFKWDGKKKEWVK